MIYDLIVIGGGPAGCAVAITAARHGACVLLLERGRFPRHKVCGEFVSGESLALLEQLLAPEYRGLIAQAPRIAQARIFSDGAELRGQIAPPAVGITRFDLDLALWESCRKAGADLREDCTAQTVSYVSPVPSMKAFRVTARAELFEGRALVNATGRWSFLTSPANRARASEERWIGLKAHFREHSAAPTVDLYFFEGGYCGVQPVRHPACNQEATVINVCAMVKSDVATGMPQVLECHPQLRTRSASWEPLIDPVSTAPLVFHDPEPVRDGMLQVGDAATFVDPFVGDGISLAIRGGVLAADCLRGFLRGECTLDEAAAAYRKQYMERLASVFRASSRLRGLLRWPALVRKPVLSLLQRTPRIADHLVRMTR